MRDLIVAGIPAPQGSKAYKGMRKSKRSGKMVPVLVESSRKVPKWREAVQAAALTLFTAGMAPFDGPLRLSIAFSMPRPKYAKPGAFCTTMPDLSKLIRSTEDALVDSGLVVDDSRFVEFGRMVKLYEGDDDPDALPHPGARIRIESLRP